MRGTDSYNESLFSTVRLEEFVPQTHPLRPIRTWMNEVLSNMDAKFSAMYEADIKGGRPSIAPEKLMRAMLLQVLYSIRSERQLVEQISYNLLFRWFVGLSIEDAVWNHSVFSKNRDRLIEFDAVTDLFNATVETAHKRGLLSGEHFSVDGTLIHAWASHKSIRRKDGGDDDRPPDNWHGESRSNETHESKSDGESRLYRKSNAAPALPSYLGHVLTDNRHGLVVNVQASEANGRAERKVATDMLRDVSGSDVRITVGADKAYDTRGFVKACREYNVTPHVARNTKRTGGSAIDGRTTRHLGYALSQRKRKCIEQCFGWGKRIGPIRQVMVRGLEKVDQLLTLTMAAYNLTRLRTLGFVRSQGA
ncbi:IS5 family transposase [Burkholderia diffusa]|uniref:IS5 family transposase n=1 Tax=Burkholderia diffusa TaxID=488732 RepID=UPI00158D1888|nr:IS5 family transposase [Burkholderia diffusa]